MRNRKILIVVTSHAQLGFTAERTGLWVDELAIAYYRFEAAGFSVQVCSPAGGAAPVDPRSMVPKMLSADGKRFLAGDDRILDHTRRLSVTDSNDFEALFYPGGFGPMWDLAVNHQNALLVSKFYETGRVIGAVCHGAAALIKARRSDGYPIIYGKRITTFSNREEREIEFDTIVPFLLQDRLIELGARYERGANWRPHVVEDGNLITGQNPKSAAGVVDAMIRQLLEGTERRTPAVIVKFAGFRVTSHAADCRAANIPEACGRG